MTPRRGAPLGNNNAFKHGLYSRDFRQLSLKELESLDSHALASEINLLALQLRELNEQGCKTSSPEKCLASLVGLNLLLPRLNRLLKTQARTIRQPHPLSDDLEKVLAEVRAAWPKL